MYWVVWRYTGWYGNVLFARAGYCGGGWCTVRVGQFSQNMCPLQQSN